MKLVLRLVVIAAAVWLAAAYVPGITVREGLGSYALVAVLFAVVNALVKPVLKVLSFPFILLTAGLFLIVVNALLFALTAALTTRLDVDGVGPTVVASLVVSAVTWVGDNVLRLGKD